MSILACGAWNARAAVCPEGNRPQRRTAARAAQLLSRGPLATYDAETRRAIDALDGQIASEMATAVWDTAITATWHGSPVWFHGDVSGGNLLVADGRLAAVIDFGQLGVGDPACDVAIAQTLLSATAGKRSAPPSLSIPQPGREVMAGCCGRH